MNIRKIRAFVDRIEGGKAVLLLGEDEKQSSIIPKEILPEGVGEGAVLTMMLQYEPELTSEATEEVRNLINKLSKQTD